MMLEKKSKVLLLIVVYNKLIENIPAPRTFLLDSDDVATSLEREVIIWDNSTEDEYRKENKNHALNAGYRYLTNNRNCSLSYVYNFVIATHDFDYIVISDDDSNYCKNYLSSLEKVINEKQLVAIPQVFSNGKLYSPAKLGVVVGKHLKHISPGINYGLIGITSGVIINKIVFEDCRIKFDEQLDFYGIDTDFFLNLKKEKIPVYVLNETIEHDLSMESENLTFEEKINGFRYKNNKSAMIYINKKRTLFHYLMCRLYYFLYETIKG
ncbi:glycosyltransferase [Photobacterium sp. GJ3]|uniref:glycosyltransferase n=1 Tax=Photobacterium sp. GJ3 TaxID=2829502 RepID=UPI001B8CC63A|nr:glycosyltransferase [Photobacterium sp. GJ3]QUJ68208.1 glycosyltransferase [Photobacterium sp. GJ3]